MPYVAPSETDAGEAKAKRQFRANSGLRSQKYSGPILGIILLRFAEVREALQRAKLENAFAKGENGNLPRRGSRVEEPAEARFDLLHRPEAEKTGAKVNAATLDFEKHNPQLAGVLPETYNLITSTLLKKLLKKVSENPGSLDYDAFGRICKHFLGGFATIKGQGGGDFYTPSSNARLLTEVIERYHGCILDPACASGGVFVESARFVSKQKKNPADELNTHGAGNFDKAGCHGRLQASAINSPSKGAKVNLSTKPPAVMILPPLGDDHQKRRTCGAKQNCWKAVVGGIIPAYRPSRS